MRVVATSNDPVRLSFLLHLLRGAGCVPMLLDDQTSQIEGSIGAIPRRVMVPDEHADLALRLIEQADPSA